MSILATQNRSSIDGVDARDAGVHSSSKSLHQVGVLSGLAAGAWLGAAEAPNKLTATGGMSPFLISLCMVFGVFAARWTVPTLIKGTGYIFADLKEKPHLIIWAILAGALWAVANTLSIFAIRDVGLATAFPLWNLNSLVGLFWGWLFFNELRGASKKTWMKVSGGGLAIVFGAVILCLASAHSGNSSPRTISGITAALGAGLMWGTMYVTYRKAYVSGLNPLSFITIFVFGELGSMFLLASVFFGGIGSLLSQVASSRHELFWLFSGGFCWVIGDMFQHYAAKYIGISRGIPLSNTNQLWGLAWGALVFGELTGGTNDILAALLGSAVMILGAAAISTAGASASEESSCELAMRRECNRYGLDLNAVMSAHRGEDPVAQTGVKRRWWDYVIVLSALSVFCYLGSIARMPQIRADYSWATLLIVATLVLLAIAGFILKRRTNFS